MATIASLLVGMSADPTGLRAGLTAAGRQLQQFTAAQNRALAQPQFRGTTEAGVRAGESLLRGLTEDFARRATATRDELFAGLVSREGARRAGQANARDFNTGLRDGMAQLQAQGLLSPAVRGSLVAQFKDAGLEAGGVFERNMRDAFTRVAGSLQTFGRGLSGAGNTLTAGITVPFVALVGVAGHAAAEAEIAGRRIETTFGDAAGEVNRTIQSMRSVIPATTRDMQQMTAQTTELLLSFGVAPRDANRMGVAILSLAGDLAAFRGKPVVDALEAIRSGFLRIPRPLRQFDVALSETLVTQEAMRRGLLRQGETLSDANRALVFYDLLMQRSALQQGFAAKVANTAAQQFAFMRAELSESAAVIGREMLPVLVPLARGVAGLVGTLNDASPSILRWALALTAGAAAVGPLLRLVGSLAIGLANVIRWVAPLVEGMAAFEAIVAGAAIVTGIGAIVVALGLMVARFIDVQREVHKFVSDLAGMEAPDIGKVVTGLQEQERQIVARKRAIDAELGPLGVQFTQPGRTLALQREYVTLGKRLDVVRGQIEGAKGAQKDAAATTKRLAEATAHMNDRLADIPTDNLVRLNTNQAEKALTALEQHVTRLTQAHTFELQAGLDTGGVSAELVATYDRVRGELATINDQTSDHALRLRNVLARLEEIDDVARRIRSRGGTLVFEPKLGDTRAFRDFTESIQSFVQRRLALVEQSFTGISRAASDTTGVVRETNRALEETARTARTASAAVAGAGGMAGGGVPVTLDTRPAERKVADLQRTVRTVAERLPDMQVDVNLRPALDSLARLRGALRDIGTRGATPEVRLQLRDTLTSLVTLRRALDQVPDLDLTARAQVEGAIRDIGRLSVAVNDVPADVTVRMRAETRDALNALGDVSAIVNDPRWHTRGTIDLRVRADVSTAMDAIRGVFAQLADVEHADPVKIQANVTLARQSIDELRRDLQAMGGTIPIPLGLEMNRALTQFAEFERIVQRALNIPAEVRLDTTTATQRVDAIARALGGLSTTRTVRLNVEAQDALNAVAKLSHDISVMSTGPNAVTVGDVTLDVRTAQAQLTALRAALLRLPSPRVDVVANVDRALEQLTTVERRAGELNTTYLVRIDTDVGRANDELQGILDHVHDVTGGAPPLSRPFQLAIDAHVAEARRRIARVQEDMRNLDSVSSVDVNADVSAAIRSIQNVADFARNRAPVDLGIRVDTSDAMAALRRVIANFNELRDKRFSVTTEATGVVRTLGDIFAAVQGIPTEKRVALTATDHASTPVRNVRHELAELNRTRPRVIELAAHDGATRVMRAVRDKANNLVDVRTEVELTADASPALHAIGQARDAYTQFVQQVEGGPRNVVLVNVTAEATNTQVRTLSGAVQEVVNLSQLVGESWRGYPQLVADAATAYERVNTLLTNGTVLTGKQRDDVEQMRRTLANLPAIKIPRRIFDPTEIARDTAEFTRLNGVIGAVEQSSARLRLVKAFGNREQIRDAQREVREGYEVARNAAIDFARATVRSGVDSAVAVKLVEDRLKELGLSWDDLLDKPSQLARGLSSLSTALGTLNQSFRGLGLSDEFTEAVAQAQRLVDSVDTIRSSISALRNNAANGGGIMGTISGVVSLIGGVAGTIGSVLSMGQQLGRMLGFGKSAADRAREEATKENTRALERLRASYDTSTSQVATQLQAFNAMQDLLTKDAGLRRAAERGNQNTNPFGPTTIGASPTEILTDIARQFGLTLAQLTQIAKDNGITLLSGGRLVEGAVASLAEALDLATQHATEWGTSLDQQTARLSARRDIFNLDTSPVAELRDSLDLLRTFAPQIADIIGNVNIDTAAGREAVRTGLQRILDMIDAGLIPREAFGKLGGIDELIQLLSSADSALDSFGEATRDATTAMTTIPEGFKRAMDNIAFQVQDAVSPAAPVAPGPATEPMATDIGPMLRGLLDITGRGTADTVDVLERIFQTLQHGPAATPMVAPRVSTTDTTETDALVRRVLAMASSATAVVAPTTAPRGTGVVGGDTYHITIEGANRTAEELFADIDAEVERRQLARYGSAATNRSLLARRRNTY